MSEMYVRCPLLIVPQGTNNLFAPRGEDIFYIHRGEGVQIFLSSAYVVSPGPTCRNSFFLSVFLYPIYLATLRDVARPRTA